MTSTQRANRVAVQATAEGFVARFYRTHKALGSIASQDTDWTPAEDTNKTQQREDFRKYAIDHADTIGVEFSDKQEKQAWDRKYQTYQTDEEIEEDAITLLNLTIDTIADKCKYDVEIEGLSLISVTPTESSLSYIENGRYATSGAWAWAEVLMNIHLTNGLDLEYPMYLRSGQITKPKMTIAGFEEMVKAEADLAEVDLVDLKAQAKAEKDAKKKASKDKTEDTAA